MSRHDAPPSSAIPPSDTIPLRRLKTWLKRLYWFVLLGVAVIIPWSLYLDYQQTLKDTERQTLSLLRSLDEHLTRTFASVEQAMQNIAEDINRYGGVSRIEEKQIHEKLKDKTQLTPQVRGIIAIDEQGILRAHGLEYPTRQVNLSDRPYFSIHRASPDSTPLIGTPIVSRTDYKWLIPVTQRITTQDGRFGGVLLAGVEPDYFLSFYRFLNLPSGTQILLTLESGVVLLTYPQNAALQGKNIRDVDPDYDRIITAPEALQHVRTPHKREGRFIALQHLSGRYPVLIQVSLEEASVLGEFKQSAVKRISIAALCLALYTVLQLLLMRQLTRVDAMESRLRLTQHSVDQAPDMVMWLNENSKVIYANEKLQSVSGYSFEAIAALSIDRLLRLEKRSWQELLGSSTINELTTMEGSLQAMSGNSIPVEIAVSTLTADGEKYLCMTARDISDHLAASRELKEHRDNLQRLVSTRSAEIHALLDASPLAIAQSSSGRLKMVNRAFESLFSCSAESVLNQPEQLLFADVSTYEQTCEAIQARVLRDQTFRKELELRRSDGGVFWGVLFARALSADTPQAGLIYIIEDNTSQRHAAMALKQSERLMRSVLDTTADAFALIDTRQSFVEVNRALCSQTGKNATELSFETPSSIWGEKIANELFPWEPETISAHPFDEVFLPDRTGRPRPFLASRGLITDEQGKPSHAFVFLTEISHQKEIEHSLIQAKNAAEQASAAKSLFLTNMSHELRTPMHAILSFSEMGIQKFEQSDAQTLKRYFERIESSGKRLLKMLNDLLDMSKLEANKMQYRFERHCLQHTVQSAIRELFSLTETKHLEIIVDEQTPRLLLTYDQERINQVFINLLSNAIKFSPDRGKIRIEFLTGVLLNSSAEGAGVRIRDQGPGIKEKDLESIFEAFVQSEQTMQKGGTGLGLAIAKKVVADHSGELRAENDPAGGAVFTLLLPQAQGGPSNQH